MEWIKRNKVKVSIACVLLPIIIIHFLFKIKTGCNLIQAEWSPGELLGYFGDVLSFGATIVLGYVTLKLNDRAIDQNDKLIEMQDNQEKGIVIIEQDKGLDFFTKNEDPILPKRLSKDGVDVSFDYIEDTFNTRDIMIMELFFKNVTNNFITGLEINIFDIVIEDAEKEYVISPCAGLGDEISVFIGEKESQKVKIILTGLKTKLSEEQWLYMKNEFNLKCKLTAKNIFNKKTSIYLESCLTTTSEDKKQGRIKYRLANFEYAEVRK